MEVVFTWKILHGAFFVDLITFKTSKMMMGTCNAESTKNGSYQRFRFHHLSKINSVILPFATSCAAFKIHPTHATISAVLANSCNRPTLFQSNFAIPTRSQFKKKMLNHSTKMINFLVFGKMIF